MRTISVEEADVVVGGDPVVDFLRVVAISTEMGTDLYQSFSDSTQNLIGGTIDAALVNVGIKEFPADVPVQNADGETQ